ncbi:hypothetical protein Aperf_G00000117239 [Anoplocephala perfoliata]
MEKTKSTFLVTTANHNGVSFPHRKSSTRSPLTNGIETNEATLVSEATAYAAHRFRNGLSALQGHSKRNRTPPPTLVTSAVVVKPEPPKTALMEVNEEDEDFELENNQLNAVPTTTKLSREGFLERSRELLTRPESLITPNNASVPASQLKAALSTALARNTRLQKQHQIQTSLYLQLQRRVEDLGAELDASVDNLRHQKARWETEKRRFIVEARELRQQLSEALAAAQNSPNNQHADKVFPRSNPLVGVHEDSFLQNHDSMTVKNLSTVWVAIDGSRRPRVLRHQFDPSALTAREKENCSQCAKHNLEIAAHRIAVERLEGELARQRRSAEQETANFSIQLADAAAENRSLRLQLSRSAVITPTSSSSSSSAAAAPTLNEGPCVGCKRLQQLLNVLQKKNSSRNSTSEVEVQTESVEIPENPVSSEEEEGDASLFQLLESRGGKINDLTSEYLAEQLGERIEPPPRRSTAHSSLPPMAIESHNRKICPEVVETNPPDVSRLLERLKKLEAEAQSSAEQLKASNGEFLQLRERLTSAIIEKVHLKEQLNADNDRIIQLESVLQERTQELERCQKELLEYQKLRTQSCVLKLDVESDQEPLIASPQRIIIRQSYSKCQQMFASGLNVVLKRCPIVSKIGSMSSRVIKAVDYRLIGSRGPRVILFMVLILYLCFLHILLANCLLQ